ncbi:PD-(D/E)XK nuclease family protein [Rubripirellula tenax]|uniref:PD-(D/E)XK nuclease family protein n=1 Tax=Rubripirellula tenax TaxID=2528015 RepID=UPI0011B571EC|nr:PD-(D/E)XK nuclease family protein [Rubripirellula tenax]
MKLFSTSCETVFAGWEGPLLPKAVTILGDRFRSGQSLDLSELLCVLPSARGTHRLHSLLLEYATGLGLEYRRPDITTIGSLAERLYVPTTPLALEFEQTLAWANVLRQLPAEELEPLIPVVPPSEPIAPWLDLAAMLRRLHTELAASELTFQHVFDVAETESEKRRWKLLDFVFKGYLASLEQVGLSDPHVQRRLAITSERCRTKKMVVLVGTSDLSDALILMLKNLDSDVLSMVAAPPSMSDRFDEFGCVQTSRWVEHHLPIQDHHLIAGGDVADQATAVAETLADFAGQYRADQVTVGVTDESQVGPVEISLRGCKVDTFRHLGWTVSQTAVGRLLHLTATHLQRRSWQSLAALVRHADVGRMITRRLNLDDSSQWLTQLDHLLAGHFPIRIDKPLTEQAIKAYPLAIGASSIVQEWLTPFSDDAITKSDKVQPTIAHWSRAAAEWLGELYAPVDASADTTTMSDVGVRTSMALESALKMMGRFAELNDGLDLELGGAAAIEMLATRLGDSRIVAEPQSNEVQISGWLDLALDDAPAMVVVGLNHPFVPGSTTADPFLPGTLRTQLRMADNDRRYARDVYAMHLMLSTRSDIRFIVGKSRADGSPTPPSRLLAATPTVDAARRLRVLLGQRREKIVVHHQWDQPPRQNGVAIEGSQLPIPTLDLSGDDDIVRAMSVTAFRDYLACPYRFYLRHVLKLKPLDDLSGELAANQFGDLVHGALERFGESSDRNEGQASKIEKYLLEYLHQYAADVYGSDASTAVAIQIAQAERRLKAVAVVQAERIAGGWTIHASEAAVSESDGAGVDVDGKRMGLRGRFDRIDHHVETDRWAILDYKTHGHKPEKKHLAKTDDGHRWIDMQLPLYRMMIPFLGIKAPPPEVALGYFNISEKDEETKINVAEFTEPQMLQAEQIIHDCIRGIWERRFEPTDERVEFDDYAMILQTGVASRMLDQGDAWDTEGAHS